MASEVTDGAVIQAASRVIFDSRVPLYQSEFQLRHMVMRPGRSPEEQWKTCVEETRSKIESLAALAAEKKALDRERETTTCDVDAVNMKMAKVEDKIEHFNKHLSILIEISADLEKHIPEREEDLQSRAYEAQFARDIVLSRNAGLPIMPDLMELILSLPESANKQKIIGQVGGTKNETNLIS